MEDAARSNMRSSPWQEAHMEILVLVLHRGNSLPDSARAAAVCRAWRRAVTHLHPPLPPPLPWLLLPDLKLCSLSSDGSTADAHRLPPQLDGTALPVCIGSTCDGRVILLKNERSFIFLNPLSNATTSPLPDLHLDGELQMTFGYRAAYPNWDSYDSSPESPPRKVVVMPGSPDSGSSCIVAGIQGHDTFFICGPGDAMWSQITVLSLSAPSQSDIAFHNGKLYLFNTNGYHPRFRSRPCFLAFDIREDAKGVMMVTLGETFHGPPSLHQHGDGAVPGVDRALYYLTESRGRLLLVRRDPSHMERRTRAVTVFALDETSTGRPVWERMESLGGEIIFLSDTSAVSVPSSRYRGARGDRVYFTMEMQVTVDDCPQQEDGWHCPYQHCEVFDMRTATAEPVCMGTARPVTRGGATARRGSCLVSTNTPMQTRCSFWPRLSFLHGLSNDYD